MFHGRGAGPLTGLSIGCPESKSKWYLKTNNDMVSKTLIDPKVNRLSTKIYLASVDINILPEKGAHLFCSESYTLN